MVRIQGVPLETVLLVGLAVLSILLLFHARWSGLRIAALRRENRELVQTVTTVLRQRPPETSQPKAAFSDKDKPAPREIVSHDVPPPPSSANAQDNSSACNALLALADPDEKPSQTPADAETSDRNVLQAIAAAMRDDRLDISLQPIVSIAEGRTVAFDAFASVDLPGQGQEHVRRIAPGDAVDLVEFDVAMFLASVQTARQRLGMASEQTKLHVAVSEALLLEPDALEEICKILRVHPAIARSIVISLPWSARYRSDLLPSVRRLFDAGLVLALEHGAEDAVAAVDLPPIGFLKVDAAALTAIAEASHQQMKGGLADFWAHRRGCVIVSGVESEAQAGQLVDLDIDWMTGSLFAEPRRLLREAGGDYSGL